MAPSSSASELSGESRLICDPKIGPEIIQLVHDAQERLYLVSPYHDWGDWGHLTGALDTAIRRRVDVTLVYRKGNEGKNKAALDWFRDRKAATVAVDSLHAKIYISEKVALLTSMNLYLYSQNNSREVCVRFDQSEREHIELLNYVTELIGTDVATEKPALSKAAAKPTSSPSRAAVQSPSPPKRAPKSATHPRGHCIRCGQGVRFDKEMPFCTPHFQIWNEYKYDEYEEKHCHRCGQKSKTSKKEPFCESCASAEYA